jgi:hypothetical protein
MGALKRPGLGTVVIPLACSQKWAVGYKQARSSRHRDPLASEEEAGTEDKGERKRNDRPAVVSG